MNISKFICWDVAQYPSFKDQPGVYGSVDAHYLVPVKTSKHKEAVMMVLKMMTSDEIQMVSTSKTARLSPLLNEKIRGSFAADLPSIKDKNWKGVFSSKPAPYKKPPLYDGDSGKIIKDAFASYLSGAKDLNSVLREAEEKHNQAIQAQLPK